MNFYISHGGNGIVFKGDIRRPENRLKRVKYVSKLIYSNKQGIDSYVSTAKELIKILRKIDPNMLHLIYPQEMHVANVQKVNGYFIKIMIEKMGMRVLKKSNILLELIPRCQTTLGNWLKLPNTTELQIIAKMMEILRICDKMAINSLFNFDLKIPNIMFKEGRIVFIDLIDFTVSDWKGFYRVLSKCYTRNYIWPDELGYYCKKSLWFLEKNFDFNKVAGQALSYLIGVMFIDSGSENLKLYAKRNIMGKSPEDRPSFLDIIFDLDKMYKHIFRKKYKKLSRESKIEKILF